MTVDYGLSRADLHRLYEQKITRLEDENAALREALDGCIFAMTIPSASFTAGHCMCGAEPSPRGYCDNHGYVDAGEYHADKSLGLARAALNRGEAT